MHGQTDIRELPDAQVRSGLSAASRWSDGQVGEVLQIRGPTRFPS